MNDTQATIMVVDDTPANLNLLHDMLVAKGYRVVAFPRGGLALKALAKGLPDLILLDVMMPGMDGFTACRQIKGDPCLRDIPVVMVTALNQVEDRVKALEAGADDFLGLTHFCSRTRKGTRFRMKRKNFAEEAQGQAAGSEGMAEEELDAADPGADENGSRKAAGSFCILPGFPNIVTRISL